MHRFGAVKDSPLGRTDHLLEVLSAHEGAGGMLMNVPGAVGDLRAEGWPLSRIHSLLLGAARAGIIELQPESGLDRLSDAEMALCPPGPHGTRLSWARFL